MIFKKKKKNCNFTFRLFKLKIISTLKHVRMHRLMHIILYYCLSDNKLNTSGRSLNNIRLTYVTATASAWIFLYNSH